MIREDHELPRAFLTCAARAVGAVAPLVAEAERLLLDSGWRTRVPRRAIPRVGERLDDRRRLRRTSYEEVERSTLVIHVPAPARFAGTKVHRELQHAVENGIAIALLVAMADRGRLQVGLPNEARVEELRSLTGATLIHRLADLPAIAAEIARGTQSVTG